VRRLPLLGCAAALAVAGAAAASADAAARWRGFNLVDKLNRDWSNGPFREEDFRLVAELGFNFVRLPMDYRVWVRGGDWTALDEAVLAEIDAAVAWGRRYGLHVCLNFHRAPGYCLVGDPEPRDLWTDPEAQRVFALHWAAFARRYRGVPPAQLSFNLVNEPPHALADAAYARVLAQAADAIRREDPARPLVADGLALGRQPCPDLVPLGMTQATRGYAPWELTHYAAPWVAGAEDLPEPAWPVSSVNAFLLGPLQATNGAPLLLRGPFREAVDLRVRVGMVSQRARLVARAGSALVLDRLFEPGPGTGEWARVVSNATWGVFQNVYDLDCRGRIPAGAPGVRIEVAEGDWLTLRAIGLRRAGDPAAPEHVLSPGVAAWGVGQPPVGYVAADPGSPLRNAWAWDVERLAREQVAPWRAFQATSGVAVVVGEFGAYHRTPHRATLRWMEDCLRLWRDAGWGWALWNFRGEFGVLDSGRDDVAYEEWKGHRLDRAMLELLQRY